MFVLRGCKYRRMRFNIEIFAGLISECRPVCRQAGFRWAISDWLFRSFWLLKDRKTESQEVGKTSAELQEICLLSARLLYREPLPIANSFPNQLPFMSTVPHSSPACSLQRIACSSFPHSSPACSLQRIACSFPYIPYSLKNLIRIIFNCSQLYPPSSNSCCAIFRSLVLQVLK